MNPDPWFLTHPWSVQLLEHRVIYDYSIFIRTITASNRTTIIEKHTSMATSNNMLISVTSLNTDRLIIMSQNDEFLRTQQTRVSNGNQTPTRYVRLSKLKIKSMFLNKNQNIIYRHQVLFFVIAQKITSAKNGPLKQE